jgi:hypothetical protein
MFGANVPCSHQSTSGSEGGPTPLKRANQTLVGQPSPQKRVNQTTVGELFPLKQANQTPVGEPHLTEAERFAIIAYDIDLESQEERRALSRRISHALGAGRWTIDFKRCHIPSRHRDASVHGSLSAMMARRESMEVAMTELMTDLYPDGNRKVRDEGAVEREYQRLDARRNACNRAMMELYAQFLIADLPRDDPAGSAFFSATDGDPADPGPTCPYSHDFSAKVIWLAKCAFHKALASSVSSTCCAVALRYLFTIGTKD